MPAYEFYCPKCGKEKELFLKINERDDPHYCECREYLVRRVAAPSIPTKTNAKTKDVDDFTKNELSDALKENDGHRKNEDNRIEAQIKSGEFVSE